MDQEERSPDSTGVTHVNAHTATWPGDLRARSPARVRAFVEQERSWCVPVLPAQRPDEVCLLVTARLARHLRY